MNTEGFAKPVKDGLLVHKAPTRDELDNLIVSGKRRISDARNKALSHESRFLLAFGGAYSLALAALRLKGFRSRNKAIPFQMLRHTLTLHPEVIRTLTHAQSVWNMVEDQGYNEIDEYMVIALVESAAVLEDGLNKIPLPTAH